MDTDIKVLIDSIYFENIMFKMFIAERGFDADFQEWMNEKVVARKIFEEGKG